MNVMRNFILYFAIILTVSSICNGQESDKEAVEAEILVSGNNYTFTIHTPPKWINDKEVAAQFGLKCFFYPLDSSSESFTSYMYALGIEKDTTFSSLESFIEKDLKKFKIKHPDYTHEITEIMHGEDIIDAKLISFSNLSDRYKEEVLYNETDSAVIVITFTALEQTDYDKYLSQFEDFVHSFKYLGNN
jgi:hypothetical protein